MAYLAQQNEEEESGEQQPGQPQTSGVISGSGDGGQGAPTGPKDSSGGGAPVGIKTYMQRNRPASQRLADDVSGTVRQAGQTARDTLNQQSQAFQGAVAQGEVKQDADIRSKILNDPTSLVNNTDAFAKAKQLRDAAYTGPDQFEATDFYKPVSEAYNQANQARTRLDSVGGRQELIAGLNPNGRISKGRLTLDEALLSSDPNARASLQQAGSSLSDLESLLGGASKAAADRVAAARQTTDATRADTRGALSQARQTFETDLDARLASARAEALARQEKARQALSGGFTYGLNAAGDVVDTSGSAGARYVEKELTDDQLRQLGMTREQLAAAIRSKSAPGQSFREGTHEQFLFRPTSAGVSDQTLGDLGLTRQGYEGIFGDGAIERILGEYRSKGLRDEQIERLPAAFFRSLGDAGRFITNQSPDAQITRDNLATADDYARLRALDDLAGESSIFLPQDASRAGTANLDLTDLDIDSYLGSATGALQDAVNESYRTANFNARSGGDSFLKKNGYRIAGSAAGGQVGSVVNAAALASKGKAITSLSPQMQEAYLRYLAPIKAPHELPKPELGMSAEDALALEKEAQR